ncbi:siderophore-interacting protein [Nocardioides bruguierae]|uniref:Siderophore-interacting protein n=1 Tax=Nocardioides bruguierae TaxID=2945102 RepID=A0A9X2IGW4_9ACTN|nr:siderophore-interacting protein [Nocardioides bruguierae]MCM0621190.1 siderophore-interacting protein [Nocardioides bruguierae]
MHAEVLRTERLTPSMVRVVVGGDGLADFWPDAGDAPSTDAYVNLAFAPPGADYGPVFDPAEVRESHPREQQPARRRYTVRSWDPTTRELVLDFVVHGDDGVAGPWAQHAAPGDVLVLQGPGSGYRPDPGADVHLLVGDESAVPAIAASLEVLPTGARALVRLVCDGPDHEVPLPSSADVDLVWVHRTAEDPAPLPAAVEALSRPTGRVQAFVHGEAEEVRAIRRHLLGTWGLERADMSCSPYWRRTYTDEAWRAVKREFVQAMDADL